MLSILEWENDRKLLHFSGVNEDEMLSWCPGVLVVLSLFEEFINGGKHGAWVGGSRMNDARVVKTEQALLSADLYL